MGELRKPRAWLVVNGQSIPCMDADATVTTLSSSDTFSASIPLGALPEGMDEAFWADEPEIKAQMVFATDPSGSDRKVLVDGKITQVDIEWGARMLRVNGKDATADLLHAKSNEKFLNQKAEEIVKTIAGRHGLSVETDGQTNKAGKTYQIDWNKLTDLHSEAAILQHLADIEGKVWFVNGQKLTFKKADDDSLPAFQVQYVAPTAQSYEQGTFIRLRTLRNVELAKKVKVNVRSWNTKSKEVVKSEKELDGGGEQPLVYEYRAPGLNQEQADRIAEKRLEENTRHERTVDVDMPGDLSVDAHMKLTLSGTGTSFDQDYAIDAVEHRIGMGEGYRMSIRSKSKSKKRGK